MTPSLKLLSSFIICNVLFVACSSSKQTKVNQPEKKTGAGSSEPVVGGEPYPPIGGEPKAEVNPANAALETEEKPEDALPEGEAENGEAHPGATDPTTQTTPLSGGSGPDLSTLSSNPIGGLLGLMQNPQGAIKAILSSFISIASGSSGGGNTGSLLSGLLGGNTSMQPTTPHTTATPTHTPTPDEDAPLSTPTPKPTTPHTQTPAEE